MQKVVVLLAVLGLTLFTSGNLMAAHMHEHGDHEHKNHTEHSEAQMADKQTAEEGSHTEAVNVGNKICPVMGDKIDEKNKVTYEYKGKIYNFCCAACPDEFKKDPEKYIQIIEQEKAGK